MEEELDIIAESNRACHAQREMYTPECIFNQEFIDEIAFFRDRTKCKLYSKKKTDYYRFSAEPLPNVLASHFNTTYRENCCKVLSYSLYADFFHRRNVNPYLKFMIPNIKMAQQHLDDYLIRIYTDFSLFTVDDSRRPLHKELSVFLNFIKKAPNVEIYIVDCPDEMRADALMYLHQHNVRTFRYLSLIQQDTAIAIIRDADSMLTEIECRRIKEWEASDKIFLNVDIIRKTAWFPSMARKHVFFYEEDPYYVFAHYYAIDSQRLIETDDIETFKSYITPREKTPKYDPLTDSKITNLSYAPWLNAYKVYKLKLMNKFTFVDLLAGCVGFKGGLDPTRFVKAMNEVKNFMAENVKKFSGLQLDIAFDEMLLLEYFWDINTFDVDPKEIAIDYNFASNNNNKVTVRLSPDQLPLLFKIMKNLQVVRDDYGGFTGNHKII